MKQRLHQALAARGAHVYTRRSLPTGVDWLLDIRRSRILGPRPLCFDVGANVGQTVFELRSSWPGCEVHAFEPFAQPLAALRRATLGLAGVTPVPLALGEVAEERRVWPREKSVLNSLAQHPQHHTNEALLPFETVHVQTLDSYCAQRHIQRIDVLKTDTEGHDLQVLRGARQMFQARAIGFVYCEVSFLPGNLQNTPFQPVFDWLSGQDCAFLGLYETYPLHHFEEPNVFCNALFVSRAWRSHRKS